MDPTPSPAPPTDPAASAFSHPEYTITRGFWSLFGRRYRVHAPDESLVLFVKLPLVKAWRELVLYADEEQTRPLLLIKARELAGLAVAYDVSDARTGERLGTARSHGLASIIRDRWDLLDPDERPIGLMQEEGPALLRRFFPFLRGAWSIALHGEPIATLTQSARSSRLRCAHGAIPSGHVFDTSATQRWTDRMDPRFAIACALLALDAESLRRRT